MTVNELIEELQMLAENIGGDAPLEIAFQPNHPLVTKIKHVVDEDGVGYLVAKDAHGYAPFRI